MQSSLTAMVMLLLLNSTSPQNTISCMKGHAVGAADMNLNSTEVVCISLGQAPHFLLPHSLNHAIKEGLVHLGSHN